MADYTKVKLGTQTAHYDKRVPMLNKYTAGEPVAGDRNQWRLHDCQ